MGMRPDVPHRPGSAHPSYRRSLGPPNIPSRPGRPRPSHLDPGSPGDRRPRCCLRPLLLTGPTDEPAALSGDRCVWLNGQWRGRRRPWIEPQDGSGRHGDGHCPPRAELLYGRVRGSRGFNHRSECTRHVAPGHHSIGQHLRRHDEDHGLALWTHRLRPANATRYGAKDERRLLRHFHHCRIIVTPLS